MPLTRIGKYLEELSKGLYFSHFKLLITYRIRFIFIFNISGKDLVTKCGLNESKIELNYVGSNEQFPSEILSLSESATQYFNS